MITIENCYEAKEKFWNLWRQNKNMGLCRFDIEVFDAIVCFFSKNFEEFDVFGKYQSFVAKILTRKEVKMTSKGYAFLADIKNEEFAHRICTCEKMWLLGA